MFDLSMKGFLDMVVAGIKVFVKSAATTNATVPNQEPPNTEPDTSKQAAPSKPVIKVVDQPALRPDPMASLHPNLAAFLDMIAVSELTRDLLNKSDNGYNVIVGSTPTHPHLFTSYADHPRVLVHFNNGTPPSTAAGRFQILARFFDAYKKQLKLIDFGPEAQIKIATQMIKECKAIDDIISGNIKSAITKCSSRWASLPGGDYGQHINKVDFLVNEFTKAGGALMKMVA